MTIDRAWAKNKRTHYTSAAVRFVCPEIRCTLALSSALLFVSCSLLLSRSLSSRFVWPAGLNAELESALQYAHGSLSLPHSLTCVNKQDR